MNALSELEKIYKKNLNKMSNIELAIWFTAEGTTAYDMDKAAADLAALRAENLELEEEVKNLSVEVVKIKQDLFAEEKRGDMHAELNRRSAKALVKPFGGDGSSWHDIPECISALRARVEAAEALVKKWQEPNVHDEGCSENNHAHDCICGGWYECAAELAAALAAKGAG